MADVDRIIEQLLGDRRIRESAAFSSRTFSDQPLIERGRDLQERMRRRDEERARLRREAAERRQRDRRPTQAAADAGERGARTAEPGQRHDRLTRAQASTLDTLLGVVERGAQVTDLPEPIRQMRRLERGGVPSTLAYGSTAAASLFYRQACLMEDYEDDYPFAGGFSQYYPTYAAMSDQQLRGYFSWRTRVRAGQVDSAPLSFAFVYVYELLCGVGTTAGEPAVQQMRAFGAAYRHADPYEGGRLMSYLRSWMRDYLVYHGIASELSTADPTGIARAVLTLLTAEHTHLAAAGMAPRIPNAAAGSEPPTPEQVFAALSEAASYHLAQSRLAKDEPVLLAQVATDVFAALVTHCARRRKTDFVEGLFGYATNVPYTMFSSAVFFDPVPHADCTVQVSPLETFTCTDGRWRHLVACEVRDRSTELGRIMHEVDFELRRQLDYAYPLKQRKVPQYVARMVQKAVTARLEERAREAEERRRAQEEAERRRITIDLSKLGGIRAAAAVTQEALLTDEERGEDLAAAPQEGAASGAPASPQEVPTAPTPTDVQLAADAAPAPLRPHALAPEPASAPDACAAARVWGLDPLELRVLAGLLAGTPTAQLLGPQDPFVSVVADTINEKLFDLVGDAVIEFDGDEPRIIEDYLDDVREVMHP